MRKTHPCPSFDSAQDKSLRQAQDIAQEGTSPYPFKGGRTIPPLKAGLLSSRSHALRGNVAQDALRPLPQSDSMGVPTQSVGTSSLLFFNKIRELNSPARKRGERGA
jgi:hypothetical protein